MTSRLPFQFSLRPGNVVSVVVVALAYISTIWGYISTVRAGEQPAFTESALVTGIVLGAIYLGFLLAGADRFRSFLGRYTNFVFFGVLLGLAVAIMAFLALSNSIWLVTMPLVASATVDLRRPWNWVLYLLVLAGFILPLYWYTSDWSVALPIGLTFVPAILFVAIFMRLTQAAEQSQAKAEELAVDLEDANHRLAAFAVQAEELATTQERNRLAREIHDNLGHYLTVVNVQINAALLTMDRDPAKARAALEKAGRLTQEGLAAVRQSVSSLRESPLGGKSLADALHVLVAESQAGGIVTTLTTDGQPRPLDPRVELTLFRAAQEGLTNIRRHARASRADMRLEYQTAGQVALTIADNGLGATLEELQPGFGLLGLQERGRQLGGELVITTAPGEGFRLSLRVPDAPETEPAAEPTTPPLERGTRS